MKNSTLLLLALVIALLLSACAGKSGAAVTAVDPDAACETLAAAEINGETPFADFERADSRWLTEVMLIDESNIKSWAALVPCDEMDPRMAVLLLPAEGCRDVARSELSAAMANNQRRWDNYLPEKASLVSGRMETELGDCLVCIISEDNDAALDAVRSAAR